MGSSKVIKAVLQFGGVFFHGIEYHLRRTVANSAGGDVTVFDGDDGVIHVFWIDFVDDNFTIFAELSRDSLTYLFQKI